MSECFQFVSHTVNMAHAKYNARNFTFISGHRAVNLRHAQESGTETKSTRTVSWTMQTARDLPIHSLED